jgi:hypothetical protein
MMMNNSNQKPHMNHQKIFELLPWYVNKSLKVQELKAVEQHLSVCLTCTRELKQLQQFSQAVVRSGDHDSVERASFARLKQRLHKSQVQEAYDTEAHIIKSAKNIVDLSKIKAKKVKKTVWVSQGLSKSAFSVAAVVLLSLLIPRFVQVELKQGNDFRTLSNAQQEIASDVKNHIRVVFEDKLNQNQISTILESVQGEIIDQPTAQGVYTIRLNQATNDKHVLETISILRKDPNVIFVEPAYALLSSTQEGGGHE